MVVNKPTLTSPPQITKIWKYDSTIKQINEHHNS